MESTLSHKLCELTQDDALTYIQRIYGSSNGQFSTRGYRHTITSYCRRYMEQAPLKRLFEIPVELTMEAEHEEKLSEKEVAQILFV